MDISINAKVYCQDKLYGHTQAVLLNPDHDVITHLVVKEGKRPHTERLVPIDMIDASLTDNIHLKLNEQVLQGLPPFFDVQYVQITVPRYIQISGMPGIESVVKQERRFIEEKIYHIPTNELAINRGTQVYSADGNVLGSVDEFLVEQDGGRVTNLVLREGHIFGQRDVFIPIAEIETIQESGMFLKLNKKNIEKLPAIPIRRIWAWALTF